MQTMNFDMEDSTFLKSATSTLVSYTFFPVTPTHTFTDRREALTTINLNREPESKDVDEQLGPKVKSPRKKLKLAITTSDEEQDDKPSKSVDLGRKALIESGVMPTLQQHLMKQVKILHYEGKSSANETKNAIMVMRWIDELLRFLAIKTITGDVTVPARIPPSNPIDEAWRCLMIMPSAYAKVCFAMGNECVIDRDSHPRSNIDDADVHRHKMRFHCTLRTYTQMFKSEPPHVFWPDPTIPINPLFEAATSAFNMSMNIFNTIYNHSSAAYNTFNNGTQSEIIPDRVKRVIKACTAPESTTPRVAAFENVQFHGRPTAFDNVQFNGYQPTRR
mmetsp:Transcript_18704/g.26509  ORF Transcript_18704/g.26509 Transcript_18704/m.26509 type:complete len:333 (+) Transcript_18704:167-1165(+)